MTGKHRNDDGSQPEVLAKALAEIAKLGGEVLFAAVSDAAAMLGEVLEGRWSAARISEALRDAVLEVLGEDGDAAYSVPMSNVTLPETSQPPGYALVAREYGQPVYVTKCSVCGSGVLAFDNPHDWLCQSCASGYGWDGCTPTITATFKVVGAHP